MSNYPYPPIFGNSFDPSGPLESAVGNYDHGLPQYPYPYQNASSIYNQRQTNGMPAASHTNPNTASFRSNTQGMTTSSASNQVNEAPYALYGGQIQYRALQSPALPSMSFAHGVSSYEDQPSSQPSTTSNLPSNHSASHSNLQVAEDVQCMNVVASSTVPPALSELEDGELDDEDFEKPMSHSRASTTTSSGVLQQKRHGNEGSADREADHRFTKAPNRPLPGLTQGSFAMANFQGIPASQPRPYSSQNGFIDISDDPLLSRTAESTSGQRQLSTNAAAQGSYKANLQLVDQKMEEAKQALRDLHSQGFDFNQIVNAGLDPGILQKLYTNIGVPVTLPSKLQQQKVVKTVARDVPIASTPGVATEVILDQHHKLTQRDLDGDVLRKDTFPHLVAQKGKFNSQPTVAVAKNEEKSMQSQANLAKYPLGKASGIKAGETKILDRKEYIARMLAAKAGKPAVSVTTPMSPKKSTITESKVSAQVQSPDTAAANIPPTVQRPPSELTDTALGTQKEDSDVESKRKAQTNLARQKIEALKLRESIQQQTRSATSSDAMRHNQQNPAKGIPSIPGEGSDPIPRPLPSRQSSYFSLASQKPPFSIPGLFMTSDAPEPVNPSQPPASESFTASPQRVGNATFGSSQQVLRPDAAVSPQSPTIDQASRLSDISSDTKSALPTTIVTTISSSRKRQKASDFIDLPSTRVKRPLGQQVDTSVIIDISDDEVSNDTSAGESLDLDIAGHRYSLSRTSQVIATCSEKEKPVKSLPPLTDFPSRKKPFVITPPAVQTSGQSSDLKGLKSKEMEIEVMNRKIAELEQRIAIKTKQTTSRTHSPRTSSRVTISPPPSEISHQTNGAPIVAMSVSESKKGGIARVINRESFMAFAEGNDPAAGEQLNAEQQLEEVELAKAEAERSLAADIFRASAADQSPTREERMQTLQTEENSNRQKEERRLEDEKQKQIEDEEHGRLKESPDQQAREAGNNGSQEQDVEDILQEQEHMRAQEARQESLQDRERKRSLADDRQARMSEIESGLPLLDAEVERTRKRLEYLHREIAGLETELKKGIEGRQGLIEELGSLSRSRDALSGPMDLDSYDVDDEDDVSKQTTSIKEIPAVTKPSTSVEMMSNSDPTQFSGAVGNGRVLQENFSTMQVADDRMSDGELEDIMDISRSDIDEAEVSYYSPKPMTNVQEVTGSMDDDENYEPPSEISMTLRQELDSDHILLQQEYKTAKVNLPAATQNQPSADHDAEPIEKPTWGEPSPSVNATTGDDEQSQLSLSRSPSAADGSDPDEYEPPEPAPLGEEVQRPAQISSVESERSFSPPAIDTNGFVAPASLDSIPTVQQQAQKIESNRRLGHFTPYESPLKQFKSFRYHPQYLKEVSNDKILVDLGAKPHDGSSPDSPKFGNGLREVIHDIRSRKIRDFNIVAGEITAYRAKYLGDSSKVLPL